MGRQVTIYSISHAAWFGSSQSLNSLLGPHNIDTSKPPTVCALATVLDAIDATIDLRDHAEHLQFFGIRDLGMTVSSTQSSSLVELFLRTYEEPPDRYQDMYVLCPEAGIRAFLRSLRKSKALSPYFVFPKDEVDAYLLFDSY